MAATFPVLEIPSSQTWESGTSRAYAGKTCRRPKRWILVLRQITAKRALPLGNLCSRQRPVHPANFAADLQPAKNVLILYSFSQRDSFEQLEPLKSSLRSHVSAPVNFYVEYLESGRFNAEGYQETLSETFRRAYAGKPLDLVITVAYPALRFAVDYRDHMFPGVPIVFTSVAMGRLQNQSLSPNVTGVTVPVDLRGSLELALRFQPDTRNVVVIAGHSEFETYWLTAFKAEFRQYEPRLKLIDLSELASGQLLTRVAQLPPHSIVFFQLIPQEELQPEIGTYGILEAIAKQFPTYCIHDYCINHGAIGGSYPDVLEQAEKGGALAGRVVLGEKPEAIPVEQGSASRTVVDWRQLRRWGIPESSLPPNSTVLYREPAVWQRYKLYILAGVALILIEALLIGALLWQRSKKRKSEGKLRESERRLRTMLDTTPSVVWTCGRDGRLEFINDRWADFVGSSNAESGESWTSFLHPADVEDVVAANATALKERKRFSKEYRLRRRDGVYRWMLDIAAPRVDRSGSFEGFIGAASDITDQKQAQEALEKMGGRLIAAQEQERSRIARELHDDICQRLALLSLELEQASRGSDGSSPFNGRLDEIRQHSAAIAADVQALSHQLHSSKLDYLGLGAALRSFCKEVAHNQGVEVEFVVEDVPAHLPADLSLCLFRVAQEALQNAVKYSSVCRFVVELRTTADEIELKVRDSGVGFDVEAAKERGGSGLISMQERVHLVRGSFYISSGLGGGTTVSVRVPLAGEAKTSMLVAESLS